MALQRLRDAAERAKIELSTTMETRSTCLSSPPTLRSKAPGEEDDPAKLESMVEEIIQRSVGPCKQCMKDAGVDASRSMKSCWSRTDSYARISAVKELFARKPQGRDPDEVVAIGAAIQGGVLRGEVKDCCC